MAVAAAAERTEARYRMPAVELGDIVLWYADGDVSVAPFPAIVTAVGGDTIAANLCDPSCHNMRLRDGVRHVGDPRKKTPELRECGCWDYTKAHKDYLELKRQVTELRVNAAKGK